ncbi:TonB-dependent receptor [Janthinobacterium sp. BJB412]|nr:TonB-dependent receptor [Janthinobacterium sp. BJB412]
MTSAGSRRRPLAGAVLLALASMQAQAQQAAPGGTGGAGAPAVPNEYPALAMLSVDIVGVAPLPGLGVERRLLPYSVQTASAKNSEQAPGENLGEFMARNLSGVNVNEISGSPFQNDITFRGFRASPVLGTSQGISVYLDGVRVNEPFGDVVNWDMLPEAAIGSVLLVPGSNPLYGLNTLGGALALTSKSGRSHPGFEANVSTSSGGQRRSDLAYGISGADHWHAFLAATVFNDRGWREHSDGRLGNAYLKLGRASGDSDWSLALLAGSSRLVGNGLLPSYRVTDDGRQDGLYESQRRAAYTFPDETRNRLRQAVLALTQRYGERTELSANAYVRNSRRDTVNGDVADDYADYVRDCAAGFAADGAARDPAICHSSQGEGAALHTASFNTTSTRQTGRGFGLNLSTDLASHRLVLGTSYDASSVSFAQFTQAADFTPQRAVLADGATEREAESSVTGSAHSWGVYAADTWQLAPATHLTASARYNLARVSNALVNGDTAQPEERFTYRKLNPAIGIAHDANAALTLFANLSQSNRVPTVIELGCADPAQPCRLPVGLQSDPYLKQVESRSVEAGARWTAGRGASVSASLYRIVNRDDILFRSAGATQQGYFSNFSRTRHQGMDLNASAQAGTVTARLAYSYLDATYDADGELFTGARNVKVGPGTRIAGLPRHTLKLGLDWRAMPALTLGADLQAVSDMLSQGNEDGLRADPVEGEPLKYADWRIRGYALLSLRASYRPAPGWELFARVGNVTNRRYESYGAVALDMFPQGRLLQPHDNPAEAALARFVAPGAPRSVVAGLRYRF